VAAAHFQCGTAELHYTQRRVPASANSACIDASVAAVANSFGIRAVLRSLPPSPRCCLAFLLVHLARSASSVYFNIGRGCNCRDGTRLELVWLSELPPMLTSPHVASGVTSAHCFLALFSFVRAVLRRMLQCCPHSLRVQRSVSWPKRDGQASRCGGTRRAIAPRCDTTSTMDGF